MPVHEFAADSTGINRVQIFQGESGGEITVLLNKSIVGSISTGAELLRGREFTLKDGSILTVRSVNGALHVMRDGQVLPLMSEEAIAVAEARAAAEAAVIAAEEARRRTAELAARV